MKTLALSVFCAACSVPAAVSVSVPVADPVSVSVSASDPVSVPVPVSASASASVSVSVSVSASASAFPAGWYDSDDGSVIHLASPTDYAMIWGRDVEPRTLEGEGFARDEAIGAWTARQLSPWLCGQATLREADEVLELTPLEGALRFETRLAAPLPECVPLVAPTIHTTRVLRTIHDPARLGRLEALVAEAGSLQACASLGRCCRSLRGRDRMHTRGMCFQPTSSSIECHDRRLEIATTLRLTSGPCAE